MAGFPTIATISSDAPTDYQAAQPLTNPSGIASGDGLIIFVGSSGTGKTISGLDGFTELDAVVDGSSSIDFHVLYRAADGTEGSDTTITFSASCRVSYIFLRYDKDTIQPFSTTPPEGEGIGRSPDSTPEAPSITPSWGSAPVSWLVSCLGQSGALTPPTNFTETDVAIGIAGKLYVADDEVVAASITPGDWSSDATDDYTVGTYGVVGAVAAGGGFGAFGL